jgi:hypothetical protein
MSDTRRKLAGLVLCGCLLSACTHGGNSSSGSSSSGSSSGPVSSSGSSSGSSSSSSGGSSSSSSGSSSSSSSSSSGGSVAGFFSSFPSDFVIPYVSDAGATYLAPASNPAAHVKLSDGLPDASITFDVGDFANGKATNRRPRLYAWFQNNHWSWVDLRSGTSPTPTAFSAETHTPCGGFIDFLADDFSNPHNGVLFYETAGADGICYNADDEEHVVRLGDSVTTAPVNLGNSTAFRQIYNSDGSLNGFVIATGTDLRWYDASLTHSSIVASNIYDVRPAGSFVRTSSAYIAYLDNSKTEFVVNVGLNGTVSLPLLQVPNAKFSGGGLSDENALYVPVGQLSSNSPSPTYLYSVIRVPYDTQQHPTTIVPTQAGGIRLVGVTANKIVGVSTGISPNAIWAAAKDGSGVHYLATADSFGFRGYGSFTTIDNRIAWTELTGPSNQPTATAAALSDENGASIDRHTSSEWITGTYADSNITSQTHTPIVAGVLVRSYTGSYPTDGHKGGTLAYYDFTTGSATDITTIQDQAQLQGVYGDGISGLSYKVLNPTPNSDLAVFNLRDNSFTRVTQTPTENETLP